MRINWEENIWGTFSRVTGPPSEHSNKGYPCPSYSHCWSKLPHSFNCLTHGLILRLQDIWAPVWYTSLSEFPHCPPGTSCRVTHICYITSRDQSLCCSESSWTHLGGAFGTSNLACEGCLCASLQARTLHTYHLLEQWRVAFSKEHAEVQDLWDVKQEVVVKDFSKCRGGDEVILRNHAERKEKRIFNFTKHLHCKIIANSQDTTFRSIHGGLANECRSIHTRDMAEPHAEQ